MSVAPPLPRTGEELREAIRWHVRHSLGKAWEDATNGDLFQALGLAVRDRAWERLLATEKRYRQAGAKRVYYLSMEFLIGRSLVDSLHNLGLHDAAIRALAELGHDLDHVREEEVDAGLGNGGLGRLAACFLDSLATLHLPGYGYGLFYQYGLFRQEIDNGYQKERPDRWLHAAMPWTVERPEEAVLVPVYGRIVDTVDRKSQYNPMWMDWKILVGVPHEMPVVGYGGETVNALRLYSARASDEFNMEFFNSGDYVQAVQESIGSETISKVLYPSDRVQKGKELRLLQEYFFVACALRDILRRFLREGHAIATFPDRVAIQLNDTHPALAVAELMRLFVDEHDVAWERAWEMTVATLGYTNHTLLPEALEKWPLPLVETVLPRHLQIIYEVNRRFLDEVAHRAPGDQEVLSRVSMIEEGEPKQVRMAQLAAAGSHSINGVAALHSRLITENLFPDLYRLHPERFNNKTNGVTPRRWLLKSNPSLAALLTEAAGPGWVTDYGLLREPLDRLAEDAAFRDRFRAVKRENKAHLARIVADLTRVRVDPDSLFDIQIKRIHLYKRQLLNALHVVHLYFRIVEDGETPKAPRTFVFAGKAAPGYWIAKQVIKLIHAVGERVNRDTRVKGMLKCVFLPDYRVSLAERIIPAADLSEQISTAGMEASGTGNMKLSMNGALTIGTLDGANIEIMEEVGEENIFIFGHTAEDLDRLKQPGAWAARSVYEDDPRVRRVLDAFRTPLFAPFEPGIFSWLFENVVENHDPYFHLADFDAYAAAQERVADQWSDAAGWTRKAVLNVARMGKFSSDRTIREYAREIWRLAPVPPEAPPR
ncbi:MAG TPA: glycogen/starch/alpha-glucan phosphorylase [Thermoanaerobaculia bacterium]|nr:glycogen/starch/alpha-glucan phosphorylase [Thermoanaerobaculia bacterium]HQP88148.1 glycogen/starch/alpha-glucan phosphorylase [Thermoanaerobaculia bacterium]